MIRKTTVSRIDNLPENALAEQIQYLTSQLEEIKSKQSVGGETWLQLTPQYTNSWTNSTSYQYITGSFADINFEDWSNYNWYWEVIGFADGTANAVYRLYNDTDGTEVSSSEMTATAHSSTNPNILRSSMLTKLTGTKRFRVQVKRSGGSGSDYANCIMARIVFKIEV